jgi:protein ImuB
LLPRPKPLPEINGRPQHSGPLTLLAGPERIESGWWDAEEPGATGDIRRDYFVALSSRHEWLWVYRSPGGWFLHGFFA